MTEPNQARNAYMKLYYQQNKERLLEMNRNNQRQKYANDEERVKILQRNAKRYLERKEAFQKLQLMGV